MATFYSTEFQAAHVDEPSSKLLPGNLNGRVRRLYAEITLSAEISTADVVKFAKLPANSVPLQAKIVAPGGSAGTLNLGWSAGSEGSEAADSDGLVAAMSGASAIDAAMGFSDAGFNKRFAESVDIELSASVNSAGFTGDLVQVEVLYVVD